MLIHEPPRGFLIWEPPITLMNLISYLKHVRAELTHVVWPDTRTAVAHTLILIGIGAFVALFIGLLDYGFTQGVNYLVTNF